MAPEDIAAVETHAEDPNLTEVGGAAVEPADGEAPAAAPETGDDDGDDEAEYARRLLAQEQGVGLDNEVYEFSDGDSEEDDSDDDDGQGDDDGPGLAALYDDDLAGESDDDDDEYTDELKLTGPDAGQYDSGAGQEAYEELDGDEAREPIPGDEGSVTAEDDGTSEGEGVDPGEEEDGRPAKRVKID